MERYLPLLAPRNDLLVWFGILTNRRGQNQQMNGGGDGCGSFTYTWHSNLASEAEGFQAAPVALLGFTVKDT